MSSSIELGSVNGSLVALALFAAIFAVLGWAVAREIRRRTQPQSRTFARVVGVALFAGPLILVYVSSLSGFYELRITDVSLELKGLIPGAGSTVSQASIDEVVVAPWYRGRSRLLIKTKDGARYESATEARDVVELATAYLQRRFGNAGRASADAHGTPRADAPLIDVTYIANEGLLFSDGDQRILIDGLHRPYETYTHLPPAEQEAIETAQPPFDGIDVILVSHAHGDHFHAEAIGRHLVSSSGASLASSEQVATQVQAVLTDGIKSRVTGVTVPVGQRRSADIEGVDIEFLGLSHGGSRFRDLQNLGHLIRMGGRTMLHVGDADATVENFKPLRLDLDRIDVAFLPEWFLTDSTGRLVIEELIRPRQVVALHLPIGDNPMVRRAREAFPNADAFTTLLERRRY